ncbi:MAG: glycosyltransferase, partial [Synergistes sp.]|nr:glycosyltransferase [Synergistes sp.]
MTETEPNSFHDKEEIKVSILITAYNHEKYIRQALDSVLSQTLDFKTEILIGDDASQDATPDILKDYANRYPSTVRIFLRDKNLGASRNCYELLQQAKGQYTATLDGDDFWTDPDKLRLQAEFLDAHPEFIGCTHGYRIVNEDGSLSDITKLSWISEKETFSLKDFRGVILPGHPSTMMKRNIFKKPKHDYSILYKAHPMICDRTGMLLYLAEGNFYRIDRCM